MTLPALSAIQMPGPESLTLRVAVPSFAIVTVAVLTLPAMSVVDGISTDKTRSSAICEYAFTGPSAGALGVTFRAAGC